MRKNDKFYDCRKYANPQNTYKIDTLKQDTFSVVFYQIVAFEGCF